MGARLLTGGALALIGLITVKVILALVGVMAALFGFVFFKLLPIVLFGWLALKLVERMKRPATVD